jgi:hypothetical protein
MAQVIIYTLDGQVAVCYPSGEVDINSVLENDCPPGAQIVDDSIIPQGSDSKFFNAWELNDNGTITVNFSTAQQIYLQWYNTAAVSAYQTRTTNTAVGLTNTIDDATWTANIVAGRAAIASSTSTSDLLAINLPTAGATA